MGPGVDPHLYKARESDVRALANADIIFYNGLHLEGKMADLLAGMNNKVKTVAVSKALTDEDLLKTNFKGTYDPHIWHDVKLWIKVIENIKEILCASDNKCCDSFEKNSQKYIEQLKHLDSVIKQQVEQIPKRRRILVTAHDAFSYLGKAYGLKVIALQGISTDSEVSTRDIQYLVRYIVKNKIPAIFVESSVPHRNVQAVQKAVEANGWYVAIGPELYSDSLGAAHSHASSYMDMMKHNIDAIVSALRLPEQKDE
jgi:manganese/zinc/iron transport system substrate-binding protein